MSLVETLSMDYAEGQRLFCQKYGSGLRFLIHRKCGIEYADVCFEAIMEDSLTAISSGEVTDDTEIPAFVRKVFHRITAAFSKDSATRALQTREEQIAFDQGSIDRLREQLTLFSPTQREALYRFYVGGETAPAICDDLQLLPEQFDFVRRAARGVVQLEMDFANARKPVQSLSARARAVAI